MSNTASRSVLVVVAAALLVPVAAMGQGVAMVLSAEGAVTVATGGKVPRAALPMTILEQDEELRTGTAGSVTFVLFADGQEYTLGPDASVKLAADGPEATPGSLSVSRTNQRLPLPKSCSLSSRRLMGEMIRDHRGAGSHFVHPANFGQVREGVVELRWHLEPPAEDVVLVLYGPDDEIVVKTNVSGERFVYPNEGQEPLREGAYYFVEVYDVAAPAGSAQGRAEAEFRVLEAAELAEIVAAEAVVDEVLAEEPGNVVPVMELMVLYLYHRLYQEAVETGKRLEAVMPDNPNLFRYMARAYASLGDADAAAAARVRAEELEG